MYNDDLILRIIQQLAEAIGRWRRGELDRAGLDEAAQNVLGLSVRTLDMLPSVALVSALNTGDGLGKGRLLAAAELLEALAGDPTHPRARARRAKAADLRAAAEVDA